VSVAKARTAACRFRHQQCRRNTFADDIRDRQAEPRRTKCDGVETVAADAGCRLPGDRHLPAIEWRHGGGQKRALNATRLVEIATFERDLTAPRAAGIDFGPQDRDELVVVPGLLHEVAHAAPHGFDRDVDRTPSGHHDDRELAVESLDARQQIDSLAARRRIAGVVQVHQQQIERARGDCRERSLRRPHGVDVNAFALEQQAQRVDQVRLVVGDQDSWLDGADRVHVPPPPFQSVCHTPKCEPGSCPGPKPRGSASPGWAVPDGQHSGLFEFGQLIPETGALGRLARRRFPRARLKF
jgi:hypothetical protein